MSEHAPLAPSSAHRGVKCPAGWLMGYRFPDRGGDMEAAREGTAAHWVASEMLDGRLYDVGTLAPNGVPIDSDMIEYAGDYCDIIRAIPGIRRVEQRVPCTAIHPTHCWGTLDCDVINMATKTYDLFDYKYGHRFVPAVENWQLIAYVCWLLDTMSGLEDQRWTIRMHVYQPRSYHVDGVHRTWTMNAADLRAYVNILTNAAQAAMRDNPECVPSIEGCPDCAGAHTCEALQLAALDSADFVREWRPIHLPASSKGRLLRDMRARMEIMKSLCDGLEVEIEESIKDGEVGFGWMLQQGSGRQRWKLPATKVAEIGDMLGVELRKPLDVITPKQAIIKGIDNAVITKYSETPNGKLKLLWDDGSLARKLFGNT